MLSAIALTACSGPSDNRAGIVVGIVTLTGLGLKFSSIVIAYAGGSLLLTAVYTSLIVWIIGLAVPVTEPWFFLAFLVGIVACAIGVYRCFELPAQRLIRTSASRAFAA